MASLAIQFPLRSHQHVVFFHSLLIDHFYQLTALHCFYSAGLLKGHVVVSLALLFPPGPVELASPGVYADSQLPTNTPHQNLALSHNPR